jgi:hypothetical protein
MKFSAKYGFFNNIKRRVRCPIDGFYSAAQERNALRGSFAYWYTDINTDIKPIRLAYVGG